MSNINFTCPHCSYTTQLASSTEGMKGNCPSCKAEVVITPDNPESEWLVMSSGLKSETPTKLKDSEIIALIRDETIAGDAQLSNLSKPNGEWISIKDSYFYSHLEELERQREKTEIATGLQISLTKKKNKQRKKEWEEAFEEESTILAGLQALETNMEDGTQESIPPVLATSTPSTVVNPNLSQCSDCGGTVSIKAATCPHCGTPNPCGTTGVLIIKRQHRKFIMSRMKLEVTFNAETLGILRNGETRRWDVAPGTYKLGIGNEYPKEIDITINPNKETIVEFKATSDQNMEMGFGSRLVAQNKSPIKIISIKYR
jgi:hypothetical protein